MKRVAILMYHQVEANGPATRMRCPLSMFAAQMQWLRNCGRPLVAVADIVAAAKGEASVPEGAVAVSFDDGYDAFFDEALPVLRDLGIPSTLFAVADRLGRENDWVGDRPRDRRQLLSAERLVALPGQGVMVGSHSRTHPRLTTLDDDALAQELAGSRSALSSLLGREVELLAYPYGDHDARVCEAAQAAGYAGACSTRAGFNSNNENPFALRRLDIYGKDSLHTFRRKLDLGVSDWSANHELRYFAGRLARRLQG